MDNKNITTYKDTLSRLEKGFNYEYIIWELLDNHDIEYDSNPQWFHTWLKYTNTDYDIRITMPSDADAIRCYLDVECKFTSKPIYHSWFMRDWYSRNCDIIVTNNKWNVPYEDRQLLREKGVKLFDTYQFLNYLLKLLSKGNKLYLNSIELLDNKNVLIFDLDNKRDSKPFPREEKCKKTSKFKQLVCGYAKYSTPGVKKFLSLLYGYGKYFSKILLNLNPSASAGELLRFLLFNKYYLNRIK